MSNDINKNNFYLFYFPNRNGMKDETGISNSKMCSISVARFFLIVPVWLGSPYFERKLKDFG